MAKKKVGAYITLDGEKEFRAAVTSCNKSLQAMKSEMKLVDAETTGNANSLDTLKKKHDVLARTLDKQLEKETAIQKALDHAKGDYDRVGNELEGYKEKLASTQKALEEMERSSDSTEEALNEQRKAVSDLSEKVEKGEITYERAKGKVADWEKQLNTAKAQTIRATRALNENATYMKEAEGAINGCAESIDKFGEKADKTASELTKTSNIIKENLISTTTDFVKSTASDFFSSAVEGTLELEDAQQHLQASTGATTKEIAAYSDEMRNLYKNGYGDAISDAADAMALVKQYTNETEPSKIKELAENGMALEDVFGMDLSESIRGADAMVTTMGISSEKAFDLMAKGAQKGLNKSGELADNLAEYAPLWAQNGFSAEEMFAILENGLESGAYNLDKVNDYVKEFGNSLADGRIDDNLSAFSTRTQELVKQWHDGGATTKQVFQSVIEDLSSMENQQQALTLASNVWSSLGEDNSMKVITSLNKVNTAYQDVQGTMESVKKIKYDSVSNQYKVLGRTFQDEVAAPILKTFLPGVKGGLELATRHTKLLSVAVVAFGTAYTTYKVEKVAGHLKGIGTAVAGVTKKLLTHTTAVTAETAADTAATVATEANTVAEVANAVAAESGTVAKTEGTAATIAGTVATTAHTVATEAATVAQGVFNAVVSANPLTILVVGATAAVGALAIYANSVEETTEETEKLTEATEKNVEQIDKVTKKLDDSAKSWGDSVKEMESQQGTASKLVTELYSLEGQSGKTDAQIAKMSSLVSQLNTMFPDLSLSINENTGELNKNEQQTRQSIQAAVQLSKAAAAQEKMAEISKDLVEADLARYEAQQNLQEIEEKLNGIEEQRKKIGKESEKATKDGTVAYIEYNGEMMTAQENIQLIDEEEAKLLKSKEKQTEALDELNSKYDEANEKYQSVYDYTQALTEGTQNNTEATNQNTEAKKNNAAADSEKQEASAVSIEVLGQEQQAYNSLTTAQQEMAVTVTNGVLAMQESVQSALESQMDLFEEFDGGTEISTQKLLANMQSQVDGVSAWEQNLSALADKGINQGILQKLAEMGPQGSTYVAAFNNMTDEELAKANELWSQSVDIQGMTDSWGQQLLTSGAANIAGGMDGLTEVMQKSGANTVTGLVQGMQNAQKEAETAGRDLGVKTVESVNNGLGCQSPSKKTKESGKNVDQGLINGMKEKKTEVSNAAKDVAKSAILQFTNECSESKTKTSGAYLSSGLAEGIRSGESEVISAAEEVAKAAIDAANKKLEIRSPSRVFYRMGRYTMQGLANGVTENADLPQEAVQNAVDYSDTSMSLGVVKEGSGAEPYRMIQRMVAEAAKEIQFKVYLGERDVTRTLSDWGVVFSA